MVVEDQPELRVPTRPSKCADQASFLFWNASIESEQSCHPANELMG